MCLSTSMGPLFSGCIHLQSDCFHISAQNIACGYSLEPPRRGGSNEYPQAMFLSKNKKNNVYPCKPQFYYINIKWGLRGSKLYRRVFVMRYVYVKYVNFVHTMYLPDYTQK